jgi:small subunit ribosomal protein S2
MLDTNSDPDDVEIGIPANDDAIRSVALLADFIADAVVAGSTSFITEVEMAEQASGKTAKAAKPAAEKTEAAAAEQVVVEEVAQAAEKPAEEIVEEVESAAEVVEAAAEEAAEEAPAADDKEKDAE